MDEKFLRSKKLLGETSFEKLSSLKVLIVGLGGVGGTAFEGLLRSGVKDFVLIDMDNVSPSNLNRQILYKEKDVGFSKVEIAKNYAKDINIDAKVECFAQNINDFDMDKILDMGVDFIVDAIDDVEGKIKIASFALSHNIPFIMSLGMANRLDPSKVFISKLGKTTSDPLAKKIRYEIKKLGLSQNDIPVVFSSEVPIKDNNKLHSLITVPSSAGLNITYYIIKCICENNNL